MPAPVKTKAVVTELNKISETVYYIKFKPEGRIPKFKPGQFLHLSVEEYDGISQWPESRVFSIANSFNRENIDVLVSLKGKYTKKIFETVHVGSIVWLKLPYGDFVVTQKSKSIVLIAGGTGIAPFISFLEGELNSKSKSNISLYYGVQEEKLIIFNDLIQSCSLELESFKYKIFIESGNTNYNKGILNIKKIYNENKEADFYISGPWLMIKEFQGFFLNKKVPKNRIFIDEWE